MSSSTEVCPPPKNIKNFLKNIFYPYVAPFALYVFQSKVCGRSRLLMVRAGSASTGFIILFDFSRLQHRCANCKLLMSLGCPPRDTGMIWSTVGDNGCGGRNVLSTGLPQIPQTSCAAIIFFLFFSNCTRCAPMRSALRSAILFTRITKNRTGIRPAFRIFTV